MAAPAAKAPAAPASPAPPAASDIAGMKVADLRAALSKRGLSYVGRKAELVKRLSAAAAGLADAEQGTGKDEATEAAEDAPAQEHEEAEARRQQVEASKREQERITRELQEKEKQEALTMLQEQQARLGKKGKKVTLEDAAVADRDKLMQDAITDQIKARSEMQKRLTSLARKMDFGDRARRELEAPRIAEASATRGACLLYTSPSPRDS